MSDMTPLVTPDPLREQELEELAGLMADPTGPMRYHSESRRHILRLIAQARAARPSPTCATCHRLDIEGNRCRHPMSPVRSLAGYDIEYFGCTLHEPAPPAQDGGRPSDTACRGGRQR